MKRIKYRRLLFLLVTMFMVLDGMRNNIIGNEFVSPLKELSVLLLFGETVKIAKPRIPYRKLLGIPLSILFVYHIVISLYSIVSTDGTPFGERILMCYKFTQIFLLSCSFYYYRELTGYDYKYFLRLFLFFCIIHAILNMISLAVHLPIWKENDIWFGRFGKGYPTSDTASLSMALAAILFIDLGLSFKKEVLCLLILIVDIGMQITGSSFFIVPILLFLAFICGFYVKTTKKLKTLIVSGCILVLLFSTIVTAIKKYDEAQFDNALIVLNAKIDNFIKGEDTDNFDSKAVRKNQFSVAKKQFHHSLLNEVFGAGLHHLTLRPESISTGKACHIENMFYVMYIVYGIIGLGLFTSFFVVYMYHICLSRLMVNEKFFLCSLIIIVIVSSSALITFYLLQIFGVLSFAVGYQSSLRYKQK